MSDKIVSGNINLEFLYNRETNVLAPTISIDVKGDVPFDVMFRMVGSFSEHILNEYRMINYGKTDKNYLLGIADALRKEKGE